MPTSPSRQRLRHDGQRAITRGSPGQRRCPDAYEATLERLFALVRFGERLGLDGPRALDRALGGPAGHAPGVLIGGTNGKGSTAAFLEALLRGQGRRTGLFTSPHLVSFRERIRIDGADLEPARVVDLAERVLAAAARVNPEAPFFEIVWGMAALAFAEADVDVAIWEVGLGGRLDATNAGEPVASAVVTLGLDHTAVLGPDIASIAREKAPIFRAGRPAFTAARGESLEALQGALPAGVALQVLGRDFLPVRRALPLPGAHQQDNAAVAVALAGALGVPVSLDHLDAVRWPARAERLAPGLTLDCAHNPPGIAALLAWLAERAPGRPLDFVTGVMADKDAIGVVGPLLAVARRVVLVTPDHPRGLAAPLLAERLAGLGPTPACVEVAPAVESALATRDPAAETVVAGSCYLAGQVRALFTGQPWPEAGLRTIAR